MYKLFPRTASSQPNICIVVDAVEFADAIQEAKKIIGALVAPFAIWEMYDGTVKVATFVAETTVSVTI